MRTVSGPRNRTILLLLGLILLLGGTALSLLATGAAATTSWARAWAPDTSAALGSLLGPVVDYPLPIAIIIAVLAMGFGLWWLLAQIPSKDYTSPYRLAEDPNHGTVTVEPGVLTRAVEDQLKAIPGVTRAHAELAGTARHPEVLLTLTLDPATSLDRLLQAVYTTVVADLQTALETPLEHVALKLDADRKPAGNPTTSIRGSTAVPQSPTQQALT